MLNVTLVKHVCVCVCVCVSLCVRAYVSVCVRMYLPSCCLRIEDIYLISEAGYHYCWGQY